MSHTEQDNLVSEKRMLPTEAAWLAGMLDGEGSINLRHSARPGKARYYYAITRIVNTHLGTLERCRETAGNGRVIRRNPTGAKQKVVYEWTLTANQIRHILPQVLPYLVTKQEHAECVLRYFELFEGHRHIPEANLPELAQIGDRLDVLNRRGVWDESEIAAVQQEMGSRCTEPGCTCRTYKQEVYCYAHWIEHRGTETGICELCGETMKVVFPGKRFCSASCQMKAYHRDHRGPKAKSESAARTPGTCPHCGGEVDRTRYAGTKFCSTKCRETYFNRRKELKPLAEVPCPICGTPFLKRGNSQKFCSRRCTLAAYEARKKET